MSLIQPLTQTQFEEPRKLTYEEPLSVGSYREAGVAMSQQLVGIDPGINWGAIGENFFKQAQQIYGIVLEDNINGQSDSLYNIGLDAQTKIDQLYIDSQVMLETAIRTGDYVAYDKHNSELNPRFSAIQAEAATRSSDVLGADSYALFTGDKVDITNYAPLWRKVVIQARKSHFDIDQTISQRSLALEKALWDAKQSSFASKRLSGSGGGEGGYSSGTAQNGFMTTKELSNVIPMPFKSGLTPMIDDSGKLLTIDGRPIDMGADNKRIVDETTGEPMIDPVTNTLNPRFDQNKIPSEVVRMVADMDISSLMSPDGVNITPTAISLLAYGIDAGAHAPPKLQEYITQIVSHMNSSQITGFINKAGTNADQTAMLAKWHSLSRLNATPDQISQMFVDEQRDPASSKNEREFMESLHINSKGDVSSEDSPRKAEYAAVLNSMMLTFASAGLVSQTEKATQYSLNDRFTDDDASDGTIVDFFSNNPQLKWLALSTIRAVENDPRLKNLSPEDRVIAIPSIVNMSVMSHIAGSSLSSYRGTIIQSPTISNLGNISNIVFEAHTPQSTAGTTDSREALRGSSQDEKILITAKALLAGSYQQGFTSSDTQDQKNNKTFEFVRRINPDISRDIFNAILDTYGAVNVDSMNQRTATNLSDAFWLKVAVATKPEVMNEYAALEFSKGSTEPVSTVVEALPMTRKMALIAAAMSDIQEATSWDWDLDENDRDATQSDNGGFPMMLRAIPTFSNKDLMNSLVSVTNRTSTGMYRPTTIDGTPLMLAGRGIRTNDADNNAYAQTLISKQLDAILDENYQDTAVIRDANFPSAFTTNDMGLMLQHSYSKRQDILPYWKELKHDTVIKTKADLLRWVATNGPTVQNESNPELVRSLYSEQANGLFSQDNLSLLFEHGQMQGYSNASEYLALMNSVASEAEKNTATTDGYNYNALVSAFPDVFATTKAADLFDPTFDPHYVSAAQEWKASSKTKEDVEIFKKGIKQANLSEEHKDLRPPYLASGSQRGLILWDKSSAQFPEIVMDLAQNQNMVIFSKKSTGEFFAFPREEQVNAKDYEAYLYIPVEQQMLKEGLTPDFSGAGIGDTNYKSAQSLQPLYTAAKRRKTAQMMQTVIKDTPVSEGRLRSIARNEKLSEHTKAVLAGIQGYRDTLLSPEQLVAVQYLRDSEKMFPALEKLGSLVGDASNEFRQLAEDSNDFLDRFNKGAQRFGDNVPQMQPMPKGGGRDQAAKFLNQFFGMEAGIWWSDPQAIKTVQTLTEESKAPKIVKMAITKALTNVKDSPEVILGFPVRTDLTKEELDFFATKPEMSNVPTADYSIAINPGAIGVSSEQRRIDIEVAAINLWLAKNLTGSKKMGAAVDFKITEEQVNLLSRSGKDNTATQKLMKHMIIARILAKDPKRGKITTEQLQESQRIARMISKQFPNFFTKGTAN